MPAPTLIPGEGSEVSVTPGVRCDLMPFAVDILNALHFVSCVDAIVYARVVSQI